LSTGDHRGVPRLVTDGPAPPVPDVIDAAAEAELEAERSSVRLARYLERRPPRFADAGELDPALLAWAQGFHAGTAGNLVIAGNVGTGKSWSAWRIGEELLRHGYRGRVEIASAYRIKQLAAPPCDDGEIARLASADLLTLDDIGAVRVSDWDADHLYALVDDRWAHKRPTIVIVNATPARDDGKTALQALLGDRVASRIAADMTIVILAGPDRRRAS
jgi:DNA replication protein DnaC